MILSFCLAAWASRTVTVAVYESAPLSRFNDLAPNAPPEGLFPALFRLVCEQENWTPVYLRGSYDECREWTFQGKADLLMPAPFDMSETAPLLFSTHTIISTWARLYAAPRSGIQTTLDLNTRTIGVVAGDPFNEDVRSMVKAFNLTSSFVEFPGYDELLTAIANRWVDAGAVDRLYPDINVGGGTVEPTPIVLSPIEFRFASGHHTGGELLQAIDYHFDALRKNPESLYWKLIGTITEQPRPEIPRAVRIIIVVLLAVCGGIILLSFWMRREIRVKTSQLLRKNEELSTEVTMRRSAEDALARSNRLLRNTFAGMRDGLLVTDLSGETILECNNALAELFGYSHEELLQYPAWKLHPDRERFERFRRMLDSSLPEKGYLSAEFRMRRRDGADFPAEITVTPVMASEGVVATYVVIIRDVQWREALKKSEMHLRQAQKMEAIGTLAGGIAHDFNNILMPIIGYSELALRCLQKDEKPDSAYLEQILQAARRARELVSQILTFSRRGDNDKMPLNLSPIIKEALKLLRASLPATIEIRTLIETTEDLVLADPTQMHQVLMNLCTNAAHAMRGSSHGVLSVSLRTHHGPIRGWSEDAELGPGAFIELSVEDTGHGIDPSLLPRICDPFFTTKQQGEGTGMGLSVVHGIVKASGGVISIETTPGHKTAFHLYLPSCAQVSVPDRASSQEVLPKGTGERILFVDDEEMIIELAEQILMDLGYRVTCATGGVQALELFCSTPDDFDLVITDQTMPAVTGADLAREILARRPGLPIILCTGFSETLSQEAARAIGVKEYVMKPFHAKDLAVMVRRLLAPAPAT